MKCANCNSDVSMADSKCPKCKNDLLQFGATIAYERKQGYAQEIKDIAKYDDFDHAEQIILQPLIKRLKSLLSRRISESEIESLFENDIIPVIDDISKDKDAEQIIKTVEVEIRSNLGENVFCYYENKGEDVLKILRAGEIARNLIKENSEDIDLSVIMFPFFKASEKSCWLHSQIRYKELVNSPLIKEVYNWMGTKVDNIYIEKMPILDSPSRLKTLCEILKGLLKENEYLLSGSLRTGISIYVFGRVWTLTIYRKDLSETKTFCIQNILRTKGTDEGKEELANNLCELQKLRNKRMHKDIEYDEKAVLSSRELSYNCLIKLPEVLEI